jgi:alkaline phosphatase D
VLAAGLKPATVYWYRFVDTKGDGSRIGRTITAPHRDDPRAVRFAFVSCQSVNEGKQHAWRRMLWEDRHAPAHQRLNFVLHLGDFIYEVVEYPEEVAHRYDRTVYEVCRIPDGRKVGNFHVPTTLEGYRTVYRGHLADPDIRRACLVAVRHHRRQPRSRRLAETIKYNGPPEPAQPPRSRQTRQEFIPSGRRSLDRGSIGSIRPR